jgi:hypothetical protein
VEYNSGYNDMNDTIEIIIEEYPEEIMVVVEGEKGERGEAGIGIPQGGSAGQVLSKIDGTDYNTQWVTGGGGGGVTDHGDLTGLADDDHTQYHTDARGDARYAPVGNGVTNGDAHDHVGGDGAQIAYSGLSGVPSSFPPSSHGDSAHSEAYVKTADSRLSDKRDPNNHASAHITGGSDIIPAVVAGGNSGLMTGSDKTKLNGIASGAQVNVQSDWNAGSGDAQILNKPTSMAPTSHGSAHVTGGADVIPAVVAGGNAGLMTGADKTKLNGIATSANNYSHPNHSGDVTSVGDGAVTITSKAVTLAKMADIAQDRVLGRVSAGAGAPEALTGANLRAITGASQVLYGTGSPPSPAGYADGTLYFKHEA